MASSEANGQLDLTVALAKIRHHTGSKLENQRAPAQLLVAIESTLEQQHRAQVEAKQQVDTSSSHAYQPSPAEYFLALETVLDRAKEQAAPSTLLPSVLYLLALISPHVSPSILRARATSAPLLPTLADVLANPHGALSLTDTTAAAQLQAGEGQAALLRSSIATLQSIYLALTRSGSGADRATMQTDLRLRGCWNSILDLCTDSRPKVRRRAQECVADVLQTGGGGGGGSEADATHAKPHPYAATTADWAIRALEAVADSGGITAKGNGKVAQRDNKGASAIAPATKPAYDKRAGKAQQPELAALVRHQQQQSGEAGASAGIWVCGFLRTLAPTLQSKAIAPLCNVLLRLPSLHHPFLTVAAFDVFDALFRPPRPPAAASTSSSQILADGLGAAQPSAASTKSKASSDTLVQTLAALTSTAITPTANDVQLLPAYFRALEGAMLAYARVDAAAAWQRADKVWSDVLQLGLSARSRAARDSSAVRAAAAEFLLSLLRYCVPDDAVEEAAAQGELSLASASAPPPDGAKPAQLARMILAVAEGLGRQSLNYSHATPQLLSVLTGATSRLRHRPRGGAKTAAETMLAQVFVAVAELRARAGFEHREYADALLGMALEVCGPEVVLKLLPLGLLGENGAEVGGRAWLLQLMRSRVTNTALRHFISELVPLSERLFERRREAEAASPSAATGRSSRAVEAKVYEALTEQIWACFPAYCELATDVRDALDADFVALLSNVLRSQATLRPSVCRGLQRLVERNRSLAQSSSPAETLRAAFRGLDQEQGRRNVEHLASLAPTLLAVFFDVLAASPSDGRGYVSECLAAYLSVMSAADVALALSRVVETLRTSLQELVPAREREAGPGSVPPVAHTMLDVLVAMVPHLGAQREAEGLLRLACDDALLRCDDAGVQKKTYRVLARLVSGANADALLRGGDGDDDGGGAEGGRVAWLLSRLRDATVDVVAGAKRDRISLLAAVVARLGEGQLHLLPSVIPEAVLATKETNKGTREQAYELLVQMGYRMQRGGRIRRGAASASAGDGDRDDEEMNGGGAGQGAAGAGDVEASVREYLTMVSAGLAGTTPHMISATITSLARLVYEFRAQIPERPELDEVLSTVELFLGSPNREVLKATLGFVKVACVSLSPALVDDHLAKVVPAIMGWSAENRHHFKSKLRHLLERLMRRFGFARIESLVGEDNVKLVRNIQKRKERAKRKKAAMAAAAANGEGGAGVDGEAAGQDEQMVAPGQRALPKVGVDAFEEAIYGSESELSDSDEDGDGGAYDDDGEHDRAGRLAETGRDGGRATAGLGKLANRAAAARAATKGQQRGGAAAARKGRRGGDDDEGARGEYLLDEDEDAPMDLLDRAAAVDVGKRGGRGLASGRAESEARKELARRKNAARFPTDKETGRLVIDDAGDDDEAAWVDEEGEAADGEGDVEGAGRAFLDRSRGQYGVRTDGGARVRVNKNNKRARAEDVEMELEQMALEERAGGGGHDGARPDDAAAAAAPGAPSRGASASSRRGATGKTTPAASKRKETLGAEFRSRRGGGDVRRGAREPYAYVPLARVAAKRKGVGGGGGGAAAGAGKGKGLATSDISFKGAAAGKGRKATTGASAKRRRT